MIRLVDRAENFPARCAVTASIDGPFVDFGAWAGEGNDSYLYLSKQIVEDAARECLGMVPEADIEALVEQVQEFGDEIHALRQRLSLIEDLKEAEERVAA